VEGSLLSGLDARVGDAIEAAVRLKHRRRLERLNWSRALAPEDDGLWAEGTPAFPHDLEWYRTDRSDPDVIDDREHTFGRSSFALRPEL
jgi:hypothetical protein